MIKPSRRSVGRVGGSVLGMDASAAEGNMEAGEGESAQGPAAPASRERAREWAETDHVSVRRDAGSVPSESGFPHASLPVSASAPSTPAMSRPPPYASAPSAATPWERLEEDITCPVRCSPTPLALADSPRPSCRENKARLGPVAGATPPARGDARGRRACAARRSACARPRPRTPCASAPAATHFASTACRPTSKAR